MQECGMIEIFINRSKEPLDFLLKLSRDYGLRLEIDQYDVEINQIPGYEPREELEEITQVEFFEVPKGTKKEEIERICKERGFLRLIDPLEFLHLIKRYRKYFYEHGDPNRINFPMIGSVRTQWKNGFGIWYFIEYEVGTISMDLFWDVNTASDYGMWNFVGVKSVKT